MSWSQVDFVDEVHAALGEDIASLLEPEAIARWINRAKDNLGPRLGKQAALTWSAGDRSVDLPADYRRFDQLRGTNGTLIPPYRVHGRKIWFDDPDGAPAAGTADLFYWAHYADITESADSELEPLEEQAVVSWVLYRAYRWLASSRAAYRRYATISGANGVDINELEAIATSHLGEFTDLLEQTSLGPGETAFGD